METFQKVHSSCMFKDGQFKSLTLVFEPVERGRVQLHLTAPTVTTFVTGIATRPTSDTSLQSLHSVFVDLAPGALQAVKTIELRGIALGVQSVGILPHLCTFVARAAPYASGCGPRCGSTMLRCVLERSPQLSNLKVDHCMYIPRDCAEPARGRLPNIFLAITNLELDLTGVNTILSPLSDPSLFDYEFRKPIKKLTLTHYLYRIPSPTSSGFTPSCWESTKIEYPSWKVKRILSRTHGVETLYLCTGGGAIRDSDVPFTYRFPTDNRAPLKDVEELVLQCAAGSPDEVRVTLEGLQKDPRLFPLSRKIRLKKCKMTPVWETLLDTVRSRKRIARVELVECDAVLGACLQLDDLLAARRT